MQGREMEETGTGGWGGQFDPCRGCERESESEGGRERGGRDRKKREYTGLSSIACRSPAAASTVHRRRSSVSRSGPYTRWQFHTCHRTRGGRSSLPAVNINIYNIYKLWTLENVELEADKRRFHKEMFCLQVRWHSHIAHCRRRGSGPSATIHAADSTHARRSFASATAGRG